jgi:hypothetical protein
VVSLLKPGKNPELPSSYRPLCLLDTVDKIFETILLARVLREVNQRGLLCDEQFLFRPRSSTALLLPCLLIRVSRNFDEARMTGAIVLDVAKACDTVSRRSPLQDCRPVPLPPRNRITAVLQAKGRGAK